VNALGRVLLLLGAAGMLICVVLPWVTVKSVTFPIDLGIIGASVTPASRTVSGTDTSIWPVLVAVAIVGLLGVARRLLAAVGALAILAGSALLYYVSNVIEIATSASSTLEQKLADLLLTSSPGLGPPVLIAGGIAILGGAVLLRP
jgi:hypothetical protein